MTCYLVYEFMCDRCGETKQGNKPADLKEAPKLPDGWTLWRLGENTGEFLICRECGVSFAKWRNGLLRKDIP